MVFNPCVQIEDKHKTFANAQFFAINGKFIPKERPAVHTNQASCVCVVVGALPFGTGTRINRLAGAKIQQKVESQTGRLEWKLPQRNPRSRHPPHPLLPQSRRNQPSKTSKQSLERRPPRRIKQRGAKPPKRSEFTARKASFHLRSKQATTESPEPLTFLTQLKAPRT